MIIFALGERRQRDRGTVEHGPRNASAALRSAISAKRAMAPALPGLTDLSVSGVAGVETCAVQAVEPSANSFRRTSPPTPCAPVTAASVTWGSGKAHGLLGLLGAFLGAASSAALGRRLG